MQSKFLYKSVSEKTCSLQITHFRYTNKREILSSVKLSFEYTKTLTKCFIQAMIKGVTKDVCLNNSFPKCAKFMPGYFAMTQERPKNLTITTPVPKPRRRITSKESTLLRTGNLKGQGEWHFPSPKKF